MSLLTEFEPGFVVNGALPSIVPFRQADSQAFTQGQVVVTTDATGFVTEAGTGADVVLGVSSMDADNDTNNKKVGIWVLDHNTVFRATATTPANVTVARIFDQVDLTVDGSSGEHTVNEDASTDDLFYVVDIVEVGGRMYVKAGESQWSGAPGYGII